MILSIAAVFGPKLPSATVGTAIALAIGSGGCEKPLPAISMVAAPTVIATPASTTPQRPLDPAGARSLPEGKLVELPWIRFGVIGAHVCSAGKGSASDARIFGIEVLVDNLGQVPLRTFQVATLEDADGHAIEGMAGGAPPSCAREVGQKELDGQKPGVRVRGRVQVYQLPVDSPGLRFHLRSVEPSGLDHVDVFVPIAVQDFAVVAPIAPVEPPPQKPQRTITSPYYSVSLGKVMRCPGLPENADREVGVGIELTVENTGKEPLQLSYDGKLKDDHGFAYLPVMTSHNAGCEPSFAVAAALAPGEKRTGFLAPFLINQYLKGLKLEYPVLAPRADATATPLLLDVGEVPPR